MLPALARRVATWATGVRLQPGEQVLVRCSLADLETFLGECRAG
ncbi:MAG: hypothetical protein RBU45_12180 [Myxococcota bacterium]|nr:hypothetical protein [Myxococcota bacterium]